jgi:hypothetical protein
VTVGVPGIHKSLDRDGHVRLKRWLAHAAAEKTTGALRVSGSPGGVLWFGDGLVVVAESPGAPGVQALLVRTGRVSDEDWARDGGVDYVASAVHIGDAHRRVLQFMANQDALFAVLAGSIDSCVLEPGPSVPHAGHGQDAASLLDAAFRKLDALALLPQAVLPNRERLMARAADAGDGATASTSFETGASQLREVILGYADGRRTARDIAFVSGRSLYAVTVEMSRMLAEGLLHEPPPRVEPVDTSSLRVVPRNSIPPSSPGSTQATEAPAELPRRRPPDDGAADEPASHKTTAFWRDFLHFSGRAGESRD